MISNFTNALPESDNTYQSESIIKSMLHLSRMDTRIYFSMLKRVDYKANEFSEIYIDIKAFFKEWKSQSSCDYYLIKDSIKKFQDYTFNYVDSNKKKKLFDYIKYDYFSHEIVGKFSDDVKSDLLHPRKDFVEVPLSDLAEIKRGQYNAKIYELLCIASKNGSTTWMIPSREIAKILSENDLYVKQPYLMMRNIILPSVKTITERTNKMNVSCEINRNKRIFFIITRL